jgi:hypothetical protein
MSLYGDYIKERLGDAIVERENGFATYRYIKLDERPAIYIVEIYVDPEHRKTKLASEMADEIVCLGKMNGCNLLVGTVVPSANNSTAGLRVFLSYGMLLHSSSNNVIVLKKEI